MKSLSFVRVFGDSRRQASQRRERLRRRIPLLERLEARELLNSDVPFIKSVTPADGGSNSATGHPVIRFVFSEKMVVGGLNGAGIDNKSNYLLFDASGNPVSVDAVSVVDAPNDTTVDLSYNQGAPLVAGTYQLFVRGDRLLDADDGLGVSSPPRLYTANGGNNTVAVANIREDGTIAAEAVFPVPLGAGGLTPAPAAVATGDFNGDGIPDLAIVNAGTNQVAIYAGHKAADGGGFALAPDLLLNLPGSSSFKDAIVAGDFNKDGATDLAVSNFNAGTVTVFLNTRTQPGLLSFGAGVDYLGGTNPMSLIAADLEGTGFLDLAVADNGLDASNNYSVIVLSNNGTGSFQSLHYTVGDNTPSGLQSPDSLAAGFFDGDNRIDLIAGGSNGTRVLFNTTTTPGNPQFTAAANLASTNPVNFLATGKFEHGGTTQDVVATENLFTEEFLQNDGTGNFISSRIVSSNQGGGQPLPHDFTGDGLSDLVVAGQRDIPGTVSVLHNTTVGGNITNATNAGPITITSPGHGLTTGQVVGIVGVQGNTSSDGVFTVAVVDADHFTLTGSTGSGAYTGGGLWGLGGAITGATNPATGPIVITSNGHGLATGNHIFVTGVGGNTAANGSWTVTVIDANTFSLNGSTGNAAFTSGGYFLKTVSFAPFPNAPAASQNGYVVGALPMGIALADTNQDGNVDLIATNFEDNSFSVLLGRGNGTFQVAALPPPPAQPKAAAVATGDLNGDGIPDLVVVNNNAAAGSSFVTVYPGKADGTFGPAITLAPAATGSAMRTLDSVTIANVSGGKFPDIIFTDQQDGTVGILANNIATPGGAITAASFTAQTPIAVGAGPVQVVAAAFTGDGRTDLAVAHNQAGGPATLRGVTVLLNQGGLHFTSSEIDAGVPAGGLAVADFNKDGHADLVVTENKAPGAVDVFLGDGMGGFSLQGTYSTGVIDPGPVAVADFNGDGFPDVVVASTSNNATTGGIAMLLNEFGATLGTAQTTQVFPGTALNGITVSDVNLDGRPDVIVSTNPGTTGTFQDDTFLVLGAGGGRFGNVIPYEIGTGPGLGPPSAITTSGAAVVRASDFTVGGNLIRTDLVANGDFEALDLSGQPDGLSGWQTYNLPDNPGGSHGAFTTQSGKDSPLSGVTVPPPPSGTHQAMLDEADLLPGAVNPAATYSGSHALYQTITLPASASKITLSLNLFLHSFAPFNDTTSNPFLDYRTLAANQQVRVDIVDPNAPGFTILGVAAATGLLKNEFQTALVTPTTDALTITDDLTAFAGKTILLRIGTTNNKGKLLVGVDNVQVVATFTDTAALALTGVGLRSPGFLGTPDGKTPHTSDPTIVGRVNAPFGPASIAYVEFDTQGNGFGSPNNPRWNQFDSQGNFSFTLPGLQPGMVTVGVQVVDKAGNKTSTALRFYFQPLSPSAFQDSGAGALNTTADKNVNFTSVSGRVTAFVADSSDPTGNTYLVGTPNGGIWRTTDGGNDWTPLLDHLTYSNGTPVLPAVGALAQSRSNPNIWYAGLGVADSERDSRTGSGVLKSTDGGRTWALIGNSFGVLANARIASIVIDANTPNRVYAAVAAGGSAGPGVYRSDDGGLTWKNVLTPTNMFLPGGTRGASLPAGTALASVTDLVIDPFNSNRLLVGLGNVGMVASSSTAGVWRTTDFGQTWDEIVGGDGSTTSTLPAGSGVGRVTIAIAGGRVGEESTVYVLMGTPPPDGGTTPPSYNLGSFLGLFKTSDGLLNFTKVMLRENVASPTLPKFQDINPLGNEASDFGALAVDPTDPNVVYVGGSSRYGGSDHAFVRVDTGDMAAGTGDDLVKASLAAGSPFLGFYDPPPANPSNTDPYKGEGVYWYDLIEGQSGAAGTKHNLPDAITALSFTPDGQLLVGTVGGVYKGQSLGFGYDFTSGGTGIGPLAGLSAFSTPGMVFTSLNGNLQIGDLSSVAIDPQQTNTLYTTQFDTGGAAVRDGALGGVSQGVAGPASAGGTLGFPTAGVVRVATPSPTATPGSPTTLFRVWQYASTNALIPEISFDGGTTFQALPSAGINITGNISGFFPAFAVNPTPVFDSGLFQTEIMLGTNRVYLTRTSSNSWDPISPILSTQGGLISAVSFTPQAGAAYAGTYLGEVFVTVNNGADQWPERDAGLPKAPVTAITVDPSNSQIAYVLFATAGGSVWRTTNAGLSWTNISGNLPGVGARGLAVDPNAGLGAPHGKLYVALDTGVYVSVNGGQSWQPLAAGLPSVPTADVQFNAKAQTLAVATLGRGAYALSTAALSTIADVTAPEDLPLHPIAFSINENGIADGKIRVTATSSNQTVIPSGNIVIAGIGPDRTLLITPAMFFFGDSTITVSASDGVNTFSTSFVVHITFTNHLPTLTAIANQIVAPGVSVGPLAFTVGDAPTETPPAQLVVSAHSSDQTIVPDANITFGGAGALRTITVTPASAATLGPTTITVSVADTNGGVTSESFPVLFTAPVTLPFADHFNRPDNFFLGAGWVQSFGDFETVSGAAQGASGTADATLQGVSQTNVQLQADVFLGSTGTQYGGLIARYSGPGDQNMYWGGLAGVNGSFFALIYRNMNGVWTPLVTAPVSGGSGTLQFDVVGPSLKLFVNGKLTAFTTDTVLSGPGGVGLRTSQGVRQTNFLAAGLPLNSVSLPFTDNFNRADGELGPNWLDQLGDSHVVGNQLVTNVIDSTSQDANKLLAISTLNGVSQTNVAVQADVTLASTGTVYSGLVARYSGPVDQNMYWGGLVGINGAFQAVIYRNVGGVWTRLNASTPVTLSSQTNTLRFEAVGPSLKLFLNGKLTTFATDTILAGPGTVGLRSGNGVTIANFSAGALTLNNLSLPFTDNFNRANGELGPNWLDQLGDSHVVGNQLVTSVIDPNSQDGNKLLAISTVNGVSQTNVAVQADVTLASAGTVYSGLVARYAGPVDQNMYWAGLYGVSGSFQAFLYRNFHGTWTQLNPVTPITLTSSTNTLRFEAVGPSLKLFVNGTLAAFASDTALTAPGTVGLRSGNGVTIDNFSANVLTLTNVSLPFSDNFNRADGELGPNWLDQLGESQVKNNQVVTRVEDPTSQNPNNLLALATLNGLNAADVTVQTDLTLGTAGVTYGGVVARYSGIRDQNMYWAGIVGVNGAFTANLYVNVNGTWSQLATTTTGGGSGTLKLAVKGSSLTLTFGATTLNATDSQLTTGTVGLRGGAENVYDNFSAS
jgi:hypothetical protein